MNMARVFMLVVLMAAIVMAQQTCPTSGAQPSSGQQPPAAAAVQAPPGQPQPAPPNAPPGQPQPAPATVPGQPQPAPQPQPQPQPSSPPPPAAPAGARHDEEDGDENDDHDQGDGGDKHAGAGKGHPTSQPVPGRPLATNANQSGLMLTCADIPCPAGDECCDVVMESPAESRPQCYSPQTHTCPSRGSFLCRRESPSVCGLQCYSSATHVCHDNTYVCPMSAPVVCGRTGLCYDPANFKCLDGVLAVLGAKAPRVCT